MLKKLLQRGIEYLISPDYRFLIHSGLGWHNAMPDEEFLKRKFRATMGIPLNLEEPKTFNEKLQWLKLYDRRPEYTVMADKLRVRDHIAKTLGSEYLIPLLGVWDDPRDIDFEALPQQFVLKCNHNSGLGMCICKDKAKLNIPGVRRELARGLKQDYYLTGREWPYRDIPRKIICEQFTTDGGEELADFKVHNFNGEPRFILVCRDRFSKSGLTEDFFTPQWEHIPVKRPRNPYATKPIPKPEQLEKILELSRILSRDIPFVRTDFYLSEGKIYFGEMTFFPTSGFATFQPESWDETFGSWLTLPTSKRMAPQARIQPEGRIKSYGRKLKKLIRKPSIVFNYLLRTKLSRVLSDQCYLKLAYRLAVGEPLDLCHPETFSEKMQWLKLYNRRPEYTMMVDKYRVREYVAEKLGKECLIPLLGVWDDQDEIDFDALPEQFVLKCNHNSGLGMCICKDKSKLNIRAVRAGLRKGIRQDYFWNNREWPYKNVPRKIIAERFMEDATCEEIRDYKWFCFGGVPRYCQVISDRSRNETIDFFDPDWNPVGFTGLSKPGCPYPVSQEPVPVPRTLEQMKNAAETLSHGLPFVRIDLYEVNGKMYFGEITFFPASGLGVFEPAQWNRRLGELISLPEATNCEESL